MSTKNMLITIAAIAALSASSLSFSGIGEFFFGKSKSSSNKPMDIVRAIESGSTIEVERIIKDETFDIDKALEIDVTAYFAGSSLRSCTPLHYACALGKTEIVKVLIENGADINKVVEWAFSDYKGFTPLHFTCRRGDTGTLKVLIIKNADINKTDANGFTPLFHACRRDHTEVVKILLEHGAEPDKKSFESTMESVRKIEYKSASMLEFLRRIEPNKIAMEPTIEDESASIILKFLELARDYDEARKKGGETEAKKFINEHAKYTDFLLKRHRAIFGEPTALPSKRAFRERKSGGFGDIHFK
jgi:ankyrin repeat protein